MRKFMNLFHNHFQTGLSMMVIAMAPGVYGNSLFDEVEE